MKNNITDKITIKQLKTQLSILEGKSNSLKEQVKTYQQELALNDSQIKKLSTQIENLSRANDEINVTEHAILRYVERVLCVDIERIKELIVTDELKRLVDTLGGNGTYPVDNFKVRMVNKNIVTILI